MRHALITALLAVGVLSCNASPDKAPQFSVREITTKSSETEYAVSVTYETTILARGDSASTRGPYLVLLEVKKLSGGDPESTDKATAYGFVPIIDGIGTTLIGSDYRHKKRAYQEAATWPPPKYSVRILGFTPVTPLVSTAVTN